MSPYFPLALLLGPVLAMAQGVRPDPADPSAAVPTVTYRSVFVVAPSSGEMQPEDWRKANAEVGQFRRGHIDLLKWEQQRATGPDAVPVPAPAPHHHPAGGRP